jgi:DNA helicase-2/ATP-dependent DNA helicase PcrA
VYQFRGASPEYLLRFPEVFPGAVVWSLVENYRSTPEILEPAARLIQCNEQRIHKPLRTSNPSGAPPEVVSFATDRDEAAYVAQLLADWVGAGHRPVAGLARIGDILRPVARACEQHGLTVKLSAEIPIAQRREIRDLVSYLRVLVQPSDWAAFERIVAVPPRGIGPKTVTQLQDLVVRHGMDAALRQMAGQHKGVAGLVRLLEELRQALDGPTRALHAIIDALQYRNFLRQRVEPDGTERRWEHVQELLELAEGWERRHGRDIHAFLDHLVLADASESDLDEAWDVHLMTLHRAKGLEFDGVVLLALSEGLLPHYRAMADKAEMEEERRLLYVGMTRARQYLAITTCAERMLWGRTWGFTPSRFLGEAGLA